MRVVGATRSSAGKTWLALAVAQQARRTPKRNLSTLTRHSLLIFNDYYCFFVGHKFSKLSSIIHAGESGAKGRCLSRGSGRVGQRAPLIASTLYPGA